MGQARPQSLHIRPRSVAKVLCVRSQSKPTGVGGRHTGSAGGTWEGAKACRTSPVSGVSSVLMRGVSAGVGSAGGIQVGVSDAASCVLMGCAGAGDPDRQACQTFFSQVIIVCLPAAETR